MRSLRLLVAACVLAVVGLVAPAPAAAAITGCSSWALYEGSTAQVGRAGQCLHYSGAGYNRWRLAIKCTNGVWYYTPWSAAGYNSYGKFCPYPRIVETWSFQYGTAG